MGISPQKNSASPAAKADAGLSFPCRLKIDLVAPGSKLIAIDANTRQKMGQMLSSSSHCTGSGSAKASTTEVPAVGTGFSPDSSERFLLLIKEVLGAMVGSPGAVSGGCRFGCCFDCCKGGVLCATLGVLLGWVLFDSSFKNTVDNKKERTNYKLNLVAANLGRKEKPLLIW